MKRWFANLAPTAPPLLWTTLCFALALAPHMVQLPFWILLLIAAAIGWRLYVEVVRKPLPSKLLRIGLAFAGMLTVLATYRTLNGVEAGTAFLGLMGGMKLLETRTPRDLTILIFVGYFLLFAAFLYNERLLLLPYMIGAAWLLTATLMRIHQHTPMPMREAAGLTGRMLLYALPLAAVLFVFFPRLPGQFWALPARASGMTGLDEEMSPGDVSELSISGDIAFRVKFDGELPPPAQRYWRGPVLHEFDGRTWRPGPMALVPQPVEPRGPLQSYRVTLEPHHRPWVFGLDIVTQWPQRQLRRTHAYQLIARRSISTLTSFDLTSATSFAVTGALPLTTRAATLRLPQNSNPRAHAFAQQLRAAHADDASFIQAVLDHFRTEEFFYTLEPPRLETNAVDDFLFNTRRGFCEHFASAFTMLARAAGIPARVVTGYQGGEYNAIGNYLIVRQSDAHAWAEVWLEGSGWTRVDPTAAVAPERVERGLEAAMGENEPVPGRMLRRSTVLTQMRLTWDAINTFWNDQIVEFSAQHQRSLLTRLGFEEDDWRILGLGLVFALALFFIVLTLHLGWQFRTRVHDPVAQIYEHLCRKLARHRLPRLPHEGPSDYLARVMASRPDLAASLAEIRSLYVGLRYGPVPMSAQLSRLKFLVGQLKV